MIPFAKPGITSGCTMVFMLAAGALAAPQILGGPSIAVVHPDHLPDLLRERNWPRGAAYAFILLVTCTVFVLLVMRLFRVKPRRDRPMTLRARRLASVSRLYLGPVLRPICSGRWSIMSITAFNARAFPRV